MTFRMNDLAEWSRWVPFVRAVDLAPRSPGVYLVRKGRSGPIIYVGMAGERLRHGHGLHGRLNAYASGQGLVSGLGEATLDRALADPGWLRERLAEVKRGQPQTAKAWSRLALERVDLYMRWAETDSREKARRLEAACLARLSKIDLWNRLR